MKKLADRIKSVIARALIKSVVDTGELQLVKFSGVEGEAQDGIERIQNFGLSGSPPEGSEAVILYVGGSRDDGIVISVDSGANRPAGLNDGETIFYSAHAGYIKNREDDKIEIMSAADTAVRFSALQTAFDQLKSDFNSLVSLYNAHIHVTTATVGLAPPTGSIGEISSTVSTGTPTTADIAPAEIVEILVP